MSSFLKLFFIVLLVAPVSFAGIVGKDWEFRAGYLYSPTQPDSLVQNAFYRFPFRNYLVTELGAGLSERLLNVDIFEFKGEVHVPLWSFLEPFLRLSHHIGIADGYSHTDFLAAVKVKVPIFSWFRIYGVLGFYQKFLASSWTFPVVFSPTISDNDFAATAAGEIDWSSRLRTSLALTTFDRLRVFNLNNPSLRLNMEWDADSQLTWTMSARYKILLGFGHLDEILFLVGLNYKL